MDLSDIHIPQADLSNVLMPYTNLSKADLSGVNFDKAILVGSRLDSATLKDLFFLSGNENSITLAKRVINCFSCHPNDPDIIAYDDLCDVVIARLSSGEEIMRLQHTGWVTCIAWSFSEKIIAASSSYAGTIITWFLNIPLARSFIINNVIQQLGVTHLAWSIKTEDQIKLFSVTNSSNLIYIWDIFSPEKNPCIKTLSITRLGMVDLEITSTHHKVAVVNYNSAYVWDFTLSTDNPSQKTFRVQQRSLSCGALLPDGNRLAIGGSGWMWSGNVYFIWIVDLNLPEDQLGIYIETMHSEIITSISWSTQELLATSSLQDKTIRIWDITAPSDSRCLKVITDHKNPIVKTAWSPNDDILSLENNYAGIHHWGIRSSIEKRITSKVKGIREHVGLIRAFAWSLDGKLASAGADGFVLVWNFLTSCIIPLIGHNFAVNSLAWSRDGRLASTGTDTTVRVWNADLPQQSRCLCILEGHSSWVFHTVWSPDGKLLASGGDKEQGVIIWNPDLAPPKQCDLMGHADAISGIIWLTNEKVLSSSKDKTIRGWDIRSYANPVCLYILTGHVNPIASLIDLGNEKFASLEDVIVGTKKLYIWDLNVSQTYIKTLNAGYSTSQLTTGSSLGRTWLIAGGINEIFFWNAQNLDAEPQQMYFGTNLGTTLQVWNHYMAIAHDHSIHIIDLKNFPQKLSWIMATPSPLWLQDCIISNVKNISRNSLRMFILEGAIGQIDKLARKNPQLSAMWNSIDGDAKPALNARCQKEGIIRVILSFFPEVLQNRTNFQFPQYALGALWVFANSQKVHRDALRHFGGIALIVAALLDFDNAIKQNALGVLWCACYHNKENQDAVYEAKALPILMQLLFHENSIIVKHTAGVLTALTKNNTIIQNVFREEGGILSLINVLANTQVEIKKLLLEVLYNLVDNNPENKNLVCMHDIQLFIEYLSFLELQSIVLAVLWNLVIGNAINQQRILQENNLPTFQDLTVKTSENMTISLYARGILDACHYSDASLEEIEYYYPALENAVEDGYYDICHFLLQKKIDINRIGKNSLSLLFSAAQKGRTAICVLLINMNADVQWVDKRGLTALHIACWNAYFDTIQQLLSYININSLGSANITPLQLSIIDGSSLEIICYLVEHGAFLDCKLDGLSIGTLVKIVGHQEHIDYFETKGCSFDAAEFNTFSPNRFLLEDSSYEQYLDNLLALGVDLSKADAHGKTWLNTAIEELENAKIVKTLLDLGVDPETGYCRHGKTTLEMAIEKFGQQHEVVVLMQGRISYKNTANFPGIITKNPSTAFSKNVYFTMEIKDSADAALTLKRNA